MDREKTWKIIKDTYKEAVSAKKHREILRNFFLNFHNQLDDLPAKNLGQIQPVIPDSVSK